jgi:hypothetical protein
MVETRGTYEDEWTKISIKKRKWEVPRGNLSVVRVTVLNGILKITREELDKILLQIDRVKRRMNFRFP